MPNHTNWWSHHFKWTVHQRLILLVTGHLGLFHQLCLQLKPETTTLVITTPSCSLWSEACEDKKLQFLETLAIVVVLLWQVNTKGVHSASHLFPKRQMFTQFDPYVSRFRSLKVLHTCLHIGQLCDVHGGLYTSVSWRRSESYIRN